MPATCPVCRVPMPWTYVLRPMWSRWNCTHCGSRLGIAIRRRALLAFLLLAMMISALLLGRLGSGIGEYLVLLAVAAWVPCFVCLDRAAVIERVGLHCQGCGYDLQGQVIPRCPECGRALSDTERTLLGGGTLPAPKSERSRWGWTLLVVLPLLFCVTLGLVMYARSVRPRRGVAPPFAATQPAVSGDNRLGSQPTPVTSRPGEQP